MEPKTYCQVCDKTFPSEKFGKHYAAHKEVQRENS